MDLPIQTEAYGSFAFRFFHNRNPFIQMWSVGWDVQTSSLYNWRGSDRRDAGNVIFQYTVSGSGIIEIDGTTYHLKPGEAFMIKVPENFHYYLPQDGEKWEFIYITLYGSEALRCFEDLRTSYGPVLRVHPHSAPVQTLTKIYKMGAKQSIQSSYRAQALAYEFIMSLYEYKESKKDSMEDWPDSIVSAALYIHHHYSREVTLEDLAQVAGLSRYHFTRLFKETTGITPIQYVTNFRIQQAADLLINSSIKIESIANQVGYQNANYFNKVFHKVTGESPGSFRKNKTTIRL